MTTKERRDLYAEVAQRIIDQLDQGNIPWEQPWRAGQARHANPVSGTIYRGINPLLLEITAMDRGYSDRRWLTFKQARTLGGCVRKGEEGTTIVFWKRVSITDKETDERKSVPMLRHYTVFNVEQVDGLELPAIDESEYVAEETPEADSIMDGYFLRDGAPRLRFGADGASYSPSNDIVAMPERERFTSDATFFSTLFHEAVHSTGHATRIGRQEITRSSMTFGDDLYGREELTAEMGSAMLCGLAGLQTERHSAGYIQHWRDAIAADTKMVVLAAQRAQRAADYILGVKYDKAD